MKGSGRKLSLTSYDEIFSTEESRADERREKVTEIPLSQLHPFRNHPFKVQDDERMLDTAESIREYGVLVPAIVRPREEGGYEIVAGHRRKRGCEIAGLDTMPAIVSHMTCSSLPVLDRICPETAISIPSPSTFNTKVISTMTSS